MALDRSDIVCILRCLQERKEILAEKRVSLIGDIPISSLQANPEGILASMIIECEKEILQIKGIMEDISGRTGVKIEENSSRLRLSRAMNPVWEDELF